MDDFGNRGFFLQDKIQGVLLKFFFKKLNRKLKFMVIEVIY